MFGITSKEKVFFELFVGTANTACKCASMLAELVSNYENVEAKINAIEEVEHECDQQVHEIFKELNRSFITPIDREDIHLIAKELDNITDSIESTAHRFRMFNVKSITPEAIKLTNLIVACTSELKDLMGEMKIMKTSKVLKNKIIEVNRLENDGDEAFRGAITSLFINQKDAIEVIKWKEIYEYLENTLDACEDVANIVEGVVMKNA